MYVALNHQPQACRVVDAFIARLARETGPNKNVELGGRDGFKTFPNGVTSWIRGANGKKGRRINGGWHISIARQLRVFFTTTPLFPRPVREQMGEVYDLLIRVHAQLRIPLRKEKLAHYQKVINDCLKAMVPICRPHTRSECKSIKFHWPYHWSDTRRDLGCSAEEKSLERKLGEAQKKNFKFTNGRNDIEVGFTCEFLQHLCTRIRIYCTILCHICDLLPTINVIFSLQKQMRLREERTWKLRDLLGMAMELPTFADPGQDPEFWYKPIYRIQNPKLVGQIRKLNVVKKVGLPTTLDTSERTGLWRAIRKALSGANPALTWRAPISSATQMKLTLPDYQELGTKCTQMPYFYLIR